MSSSSPSADGARRAVWRWHFYAGLMVMPLLCLMALTGGLYLFKPEIESLAYARLLQVQPTAERVSPDVWIETAQTALGGHVVSLSVPDRPDRAIRLTVSTPQGERTAFVDPHDGRLTGSFSGRGLMDVVKRVHSLEILGRPFNILVEIVAGWAVILVATGLWLWAPRPGRRAVLTPRPSDAPRRPFWRDLHAATGLYTGLIVAFLAITGMPWSAVWGDRFLGAMRDGGWGRPPAPAAASPWSHADHPDDRPAGTGWTLEGAVLPAPDHAAGAPPPSLALVTATVQGHGLPAPYTVSVPRDPALAWTVSRETLRAEDARSLYVDGRTGRVLADLRWDQFGPGARAFEWGIAVHQGLQYGWLNRLVMLAGCIGVWLLAIAGLVMWLRRRPKGRLAAPPAPPGLRARAVLLGLVVPFAVLYPLTGLSLLAALGLERLWRALRPTG